MNQLISDLKSIPGVIGAAVYRSKQGIICNNLPSLFKSERLVEISKLLFKINAAGKMNFPDLSEVLISYDESLVVCRQLTDNDLLLAICDPSINKNLLSMSLNLAFEEFFENRESPVKTETSTSPGNPAPLAEPDIIDPAQLRTAGPLAKPLQVMNKALSKFMGPIATIVFDDALSLWAQTQQPAEAGLPKLLEILCKEIGDEKKAGAYREMVQSQLSD